MQQHWTWCHFVRAETSMLSDLPFFVRRLLWPGMCAQRWCTWSYRCQTRARSRWEQLPRLWMRDIIKPLAPVSFPLTFLLSETHRAESSGIASRWPCPLWVWTLCLLSRWWTLWGAQIWKTNSFLKMYLKQPSVWWLATALTHSHWAAFPGL